MRSLFDPQGFYFFAGKTIKPLFALAAVLAAVALYLGFFVCPIDATQGNSYRIIFIHVSSAWMSMLIYVLMAVFSAFALATNTRMCSIFAAAMAPTASDLGRLLGLGCTTDERTDPAVPLSRLFGAPELYCGH